MKFSNSVEKKYEGINQLKQKGTPNIYYKKTQNICSLKTQKYNIPKDVYIFDTYQNMLKEIDLIFPAMPKKVDLNTIEKKMRKDMIQQMKNFLHKYRLNQICLYYSIYIMDKLLAKRIKLNVNEVAVTSLLISIKFLDIDGHIPPINHFLELLKNNQKISIKELSILEIECLKKLNYKLSIPQPIDFINLILMNGIVFNTDVSESKIGISGSIYNLPIEIYEDIITYNTDYLQFHPLYLAFTCISISRELYHLDKWNPFIKVFNISFSEFEEVYQFIYDMYMEIREKKKKKEEEILKRKKEIEIIQKEKSIINTKEKSCSQVDILHKKNLNKQDSLGNYFVKSDKIVDSMKNPIDMKSLRHYYINKTRSLNFNFEQLDFLFKTKKEVNNQELNETISQSTVDSIKRNVIEIPKKISINQRLKNNDLIKGLKSNQSYNNYNQQLKIELPNSIKDKKNIKNENTQNKLNEDKNDKNSIFYNPVQKKTNLSRYTVLNTLNSTLSKARRSFLKEAKNSSLSILNSSLNNSLNTINFQNFHNSFANNNSLNGIKTTKNNNSNLSQSYQIKVFPRNNHKIQLPTEVDNYNKTISKKYDYLFTNK